MNKDVVNVPNLLSVSRFFLAMLLFYFIVTHQPMYSFTTYAVAMLTDFFDGFLARRSGKLTKVGYYLDAYADNTIIAVTFIAFFLAGTISVYEFFGYLLIVSITTTGFFISPSRDIFYQAFEIARMKRFAGAFIMLFIISGLLELEITSPYITVLSFTVVLIASSVFLYNVFRLKKEAKKHEG